MKIIKILFLIQLMVACTQSRISAFQAASTKVTNPDPASVNYTYLFTVSASKTDLSDIALESSNSVTLTIANTGSGKLTNLSFSSLSSPWSYSTSGTCKSELESKTTCTKIVSLTPKAIGELSAAIEISADKVTKQTQKLIANAYQKVAVSSVYPSNAKWNDYVKRTVTTTDNFSQTEAACTTSDQSYGGCFHGGVMRKASLSGHTSCTGLNVQDSLSALNWICQVTNGVATAYSFGLKEDKRLSDLVDSSSWKQIGLVVTSNNKSVYKSDPETWWTNTVMPLPDSPITLSTEGVIYTLDSAKVTPGYTITADKVAISMTSNGSISSSLSYTFTSSKSFLWFEGTYKMDVPWVSLELTGGIRDYIRNANFALTTGATGIDGYANSMRYRNLRFTGDGNLNNTVSAFNGSSGAYPSTFDNIKIYSLGGIWNSNGSAVFTRSTFAGGDNTSYCPLGSAVASSKIIIHASTFANNTNPICAIANIAASQTVFVNNLRGFSRINAGAPTFVNNYVLANVVSANNNSYGYYLQAGTAAGNIVADSNATGACTVSGGTSALADISCAAQNGSTATVNTSLTGLASSFVGGVTATDSKNGSNTLGLSAYASITDFFKFENLFRMWGNLSTSFPSAGNRGACLSGNCQIWDFRISKTDNLLRNRSGLLTSENETFKSGSTCPSAVNGAKIVTLTSGLFGTYLVTDHLMNAVEIPDDPYGNDNGLCESNEACLYHPNYGSYLGEGDWLNNGTCTFEDGVISNVKMFAYPTNGG